MVNERQRHQIRLSPKFVCAFDMLVDASQCTEINQPSNMSDAREMKPFRGSEVNYVKFYSHFIVDLTTIIHTAMVCRTFGFPFMITCRAPRMKRFSFDELFRSIHMSKVRCRSRRRFLCKLEIKREEDEDISSISIENEISVAHHRQTRDQQNKTKMKKRNQLKFKFCRFAAWTAHKRHGRIENDTINLTNCSLGRYSHINEVSMQIICFIVLSTHLSLVRCLGAIVKK